MPQRTEGQRVRRVERQPDGRVPWERCESDNGGWRFA
jgi:hypothetical protein